MTTQPIRKICLDIGNGNMKGAEVRDGRVVTALLPSQVGVGDTHLGALGLGGITKAKRELKPVSVAFDGGNYLVGHNVTRYTRPLERLDAGKYTESMEVRALTYALLAQLVDGGATDLAAVVALPVSIMMAPDVKDTIKGIESWLIGAHRFTYDGRASHITIHALKVMAQPTGAFFAWGLNEAGQWVRAESDLTEANVAVLDSGFNTLDLLLVKQGRVEKRFTGGETLGVRRAAEEIARVIRARFGFDLARVEADAHIRRYLDKQEPVVILDGERHDLKPIIKQALGTLATDTINFVEETWGKAEISYLLLAGGGALLLDGALRRRMPRATMLPDPVTANAVGLAKLAQRPGVFKGLPEAPKAD